MGLSGRWICVKDVSVMMVTSSVTTPPVLPPGVDQGKYSNNSKTIAVHSVYLHKVRSITHTVMHFVMNFYV